MKDTFEKGIDLFNEESFFEAHEIWEKQWRETEDPGEKAFLQGMIMIAAALHHYRRGEYAGTFRLLERGLSRIRDAGEVTQGIDVGDFAKKVSVFYDRIKVPGTRAAESAFPPELPKITKRTVHARE